MLPLRLTIGDSSQVGEARRRAAALALEVGWGEQKAGTVELVVTELAKNLIKHADEGEVLMWPEPEGQALTILSLDSGPGIRNVSQAISDGYSTAGSPGTGLGAIKRLSADFEIFSQVGKGTAVLARLGSPAHLLAPTDLSAGGFRLPMDGETSSGDGVAWGSHEGRFLAFVVDGLGHGILASEAAEVSLRTFRRNIHLPPHRLLEAVHLSLRATRGGVAGVAEVSADRKVVNYAGIGNISAVIHSPEGSRNMVSYNGTLGQDVRKFQTFSYPWSSEAMLVMHSDGLSNKWDIADSPSLERKQPALVAGVLYRDFSRKRDDLSVLVAKQCRS